MYSRGGLNNYREASSLQNKIFSRVNKTWRQENKMFKEEKTILEYT